MGIRALSNEELVQVSGGFFCCVPPSCGQSTQTALAGLIGGEAGLKTGVYNLFADLVNGSSFSTISQDLKAIGSDYHLGYNIGSAMSVSSALNFLGSAVGSISSAINSGFSSGTFATVTFPPSIG